MKARNPPVHQRPTIFSRFLTYSLSKTDLETTPNSGCAQGTLSRAVFRRAEERFSGDLALNFQPINPDNVTDSIHVGEDDPVPTANLEHSKNM